MRQGIFTSNSLDFSTFPLIQNNTKNAKVFMILLNMLMHLKL
jgi:hypothetical protein